MDLKCQARRILGLVIDEEEIVYVQRDNNVKNLKMLGQE